MGWVIAIIFVLAVVSYSAYCNCAEKAEYENYKKKKDAWEAAHPYVKNSWGWGYKPVPRQTIESVNPPPLPHYPVYPESRLEKMFNWVIDCLLPEMPLNPPPEKSVVQEEEWQKAKDEWAVWSQKPEEVKYEREIPESLGRSPNSTAK